MAVRRTPYMRRSGQDAGLRADLPSWPCRFDSRHPLHHSPAGHGLAERSTWTSPRALALREQAREEPGTCTYRWFSADAALAHNEHVAELLARVGARSRPRVTMFADLGEER